MTKHTNTLIPSPKLLTSLTIFLLSVSYAQIGRTQTDVAPATPHAPSEAECEKSLKQGLIGRLKMLYPKDTRLEIVSIDIDGPTTRFCDIQPKSLTFVYGPVAGKAAYAFKSNDESSRHCVVMHKALRKGLVAKRRYRPGETLISEDFDLQEIDVAQYLPFEAKQEYLSGPIENAAYEAYATILEGRPLLSQNVKAAPKIRKGDRVRIEVISGGVVLEAAGVAQEMGYVAQPMKVKLPLGQKELTGLVTKDGRVQVGL